MKKITVKKITTHAELKEAVEKVLDYNWDDDAKGGASHNQSV